ncbi:MAG: HIT domain-containing protein [Candidatus Krumholzibacteria bacterium]|nr:HIT domain-containing protein [Candidatus Krumholzibacteria bacterium]
MPGGEGCLFCNIQKDTQDEAVGILKRGKHWYVILNMFPYTNGHVMVVAMRHFERLSDMTEKEGEELVGMLAMCERAIDAAYHPDGLNVGVNRGSTAGAGVEGHLHFHLCPRWHGDTNFMTALAGTRVVSEDLEDSYRKLVPFFNG